MGCMEHRRVDVEKPRLQTRSPYGQIEIKSLRSILETMNGGFDELVILLLSLYIALGIRPAIILYDLMLNGYPDSAAGAVPYSREEYIEATHRLPRLLGIHSSPAEPLSEYTVLATRIGGAWV